MTKEPKNPTAEPTPGTPAADPGVSAAEATAAAESAVAAERKRGADIRALTSRHGLATSFADELVNEGVTLDAARARVLDELTSVSARGPSGIPAPVVLGEDERDRFIDGASAWLIQKAGRARLIEKHTGQRPDPGEFRGMSLLDLARESLGRVGFSTRGMGKMELAGAALGARADAGLGTRSDFPVLLENVLHKMLQAAYGTTPDTWRAFCAEGAVSDFRPHLRLRLGSFGSLDALHESGEFQQKHFPDAEKESITASTKGNIVGITRPAIVNDDVDGFSRLVTMLGRAAARSIEVDVYATLALNSGLGPTMGDSKTLFHADHNNIGDGAAITAAAIDADRVLMASQKDQNGNDFLDLRPSVLVLPIGLGSKARQINEAQFDPDTAGALKPNTSNGLFDTIVDTPRISGTRRYLFADPSIAPVLEVVFLDGQSSPVLDTEEGFDYDGIRWRARFDYGVGATDFRGAVTDAGA